MPKAGLAAMGSGLDLSTRYFWRVVGRPIDIDAEHARLDSPSNTRGAIGDEWSMRWRHSAGSACLTR